MSAIVVVRGEPKFKVNSELRYQNKSSECQQDVRKHYVIMSICRYVRTQLFSLGIKMKVVQNVITEIAKLLDFRSNPGLTSRVSELEIGSNNCPSGAFRSDPLET